jgi:23S rRNA (guanosine2251-2'-O)-methyltransferase
LKKESIIFGIRPVIEAMKSGKEIEKLLIQKGLRGEGFHSLNSLSRELGIPMQFVPVDKLNQVTRLNHQGVIAFISEIVYHKLESVLPFAYEQGKGPLVLMLDRITDVRNLGAIARTAECAGVDGLLLPEKGSAQINAVAVKTSAGALYKLPVCRSHNLKESIRFMKDSGLKIIAATEKASIDYTTADFTKPMALIMGSEQDGVSEEYLKLTDERVRIPILGEIESLNVSVAAGIILYEILRQRKESEK